MKNSQSPIELLRGYGATGMKMTLNLQQCQALGRIHNRLSERVANMKEGEPDPLSAEENELGGFLQAFAQFSTPVGDLWADFAPETKEEEGAKVVGRINLEESVYRPH